MDPLRNLRSKLAPLRALSYFYLCPSFLLLTPLTFPSASLICPPSNSYSSIPLLTTARPFPPHSSPTSPCENHLLIGQGHSSFRSCALHQELLRESGSLQCSNLQLEILTGKIECFIHSDVLQRCPGGCLMYVPFPHQGKKKFLKVSSINICGKF